MRYGAYGVNYSPISRRNIFRRVFTRFAARFLAQAFFMLISFIFSYSEKFCVVFYLSLYFVLGQGPSARDNGVGDDVVGRPFVVGGVLHRVQLEWRVE